MIGQHVNRILDFESARERREAGIQASQDHAHEEAPDWPERAYDYLCRFAALQAQPWICEQFRAWAIKSGLDQPPDGRAYGGITQRALRHGVIVKVGYAPAASSNGSVKPLYARPVQEMAA